MTQEEKELLIKDLCARLPYEVKVKFYDHWVDEYEIIPLTAKLLSDTVYIGDIRPYLFPLSNMTEEEKKYISDKCGFSISGPIGGEYGLIMPVPAADWLIDFYNEHHIDYRGLIPMGLARDATGLNIY